MAKHDSLDTQTRELVRFAAAASGHPRPVLALPDGAARLQARLMELMPGEPLLSRDEEAVAAAPERERGRYDGDTAIKLYLREIGQVKLLTVQEEIDLAAKIKKGDHVVVLAGRDKGKRGTVRPKPPIPALEGLFGKPTVINNVLSFAAVPFILAKGGAAYKNYGMGRSRGTLPIQLGGKATVGRGRCNLHFAKRS